MVDMMNHYMDVLGLKRASHELRVIHVAGTKGKGLPALSRNLYCGHMVCAQDSLPPHTWFASMRGLDLTELQLEMHLRQALLACLGRTLERAEETNVLMRPTFFRFLFLVCLSIFTDPEVALDVAIIEVGKGGRLDATNVFERPWCACHFSTMITCTFLDTIGQIAGEKAGIMKRGSTCISSPQ